MTPTKEQLEALAALHMTDQYNAECYCFTLDQLDAYFLERLKMVAGEPVGYFIVDDPKVFAMPGSGFSHGKDIPKDVISATPLYKLELYK